jgi:hypothetical protein
MLSADGVQERFPMRDDDKTPIEAGPRILAGLIAAGLGAFVIYGLVTGDISSGRYAYLKRATDPLFFWGYICLFAAAAICAALFALGRIEPRKSPVYIENLARKRASDLAVLALLGSVGAGYHWFTEQSAGRHGVMTEVAGWMSLAMLGLATWPPLLPPGSVRTALRAAGTLAVVFAAAMLLLLLR